MVNIMISTLLSSRMQYSANVIQARSKKRDLFRKLQSRKIKDLGEKYRLNTWHPKETISKTEGYNGSRHEAERVYR